MDLQEQLLNILDEELVFALGCTEPTALALAAANCRQVLGDFPDHIHARLSGNMIKNVQGVTIPHSHGLKGIRNAIILGTLIGNPEEGLQVLEAGTDEQINQVPILQASGICTYERKNTDVKLYIEVEMTKGSDTAIVELQHTHTNITRIQKNGKELFYNPCNINDFNSSLTSRKELSVEAIYNFVENIDYERLIPILQKQFEYNCEIAEEGMKNDWGLNVGRAILLADDRISLHDEMRAYAAAGSDARMAGCDLPVVINSGSGNQGMTIAVPISIYAKENHISDEMKYKALALANLIPIHIKTSIGRLSAFCGAITASIGVGAAIAYLETKDLVVIENTIKNSIANLTGVICDGAKPSCALKIASGLDAALVAKTLATKGIVVQSGTGIITDSIEESIQNMTSIASNAMLETDEMIIEIMQTTRK